MTNQKRSHYKGGRQHRHVVRVSPEEEAKLLLAAGAPSKVAGFLMESAMAVIEQSDDRPLETVTSRRKRMEELFAARHQLAEVAVQMRRIGTNVNQVARAANQGQSVPVDAMRTYLADADRAVAEARAVAVRIDAAIDELAAAGVS